MFSITSILCIIVTSFIRIRTNKTTANHEKELDDLSVEKTKKKKKTKESESRLSTLVPLFKNIDVIVFLSLTLVWGMSYAGLDPVSSSISSLNLIILFFILVSIFIYR
jgi:hypothetical protein